MESNGNTRIGTDAVFLTVSKVVTMAITMVTAMLLSRFRTTEEYGTYSQLLLVISLFSSIFMMGLPGSINYFLARAENKEQEQRFLSVYYTLNTILSLVVGLALVLAIPLIESYFRNPAIRGFLYFLALYPWANIISSSIENVLVVYGKTKFLMVYRALNSICLLGSVVVVQWTGLGFREYMVCYLAVYSLFALSVYWIVARLSGRLRFLIDRATVKEILIFSLPLGLSSVVGTLSIEVDKLLIGRLMDTSQLAIYTNASKELPVTIIAASITAVLMPRLARMLKDKKREEAIALWGKSTELSMICTAIIVFGVFTYAKEVIEILYSEKYLPGISVFRVYTLVLLLRVTYFGIVLNAMGKTKEIFYCSIGSLVLNAVLNPLFYYAIGMTGPAVATFLSILIMGTTQLVMTSRQTGVPFSRIFPWKGCGIILAVNGVLAVIFYFLKRWIPLELLTGEIAESIILGAVWVGAYGLVMLRRIRSLWKELNG